ncbi:MAG: hydroxyacylglutathione hydrolase [Colwellia sp.]|jgi:hydroxyacylglutathione hydrolase
MLKHEIIPVTLFEQNCSLFWCSETKQAAVVDPSGDIEKIKAGISKHGLTLEKILITHAHIDHAGATNALASHFDVLIEGPHKEDQFWIDGIEDQKRRFGVSFAYATKFTPKRFLEQSDTVSFGNIMMEVYFCPGHTPGHVVFFHRESRIAQVGDVLFSGSIDRINFPRGDHATLINSIRNNLFHLGDYVRFIPGHGPMSTFGQERRYNPDVSDAVVGFR